MRRMLLAVMVTGLLATPAHAVVFWDDEMDGPSSGFYYAPNFAANNMVYAFDATVKISGTASIRVNFPLACDIPPGQGTTGQCGGSLTRTFPDTASVYKRAYFRMSGSGPNPTPSGLFQASALSHTKMLKGQSLSIAGASENNIRHWWEIGCCGAKTFNISAEHVPTYFSTTNFFSSIVLQDNRWYCIETHEVVNTPGVANGVAEAWVDGVKVLTRTDIIWQRAGSNFLWHEFSLMRQNGAGNFWWDRLAAGDTRIGCIGSNPGGDTTAPATPAGWTVQ